MIYAHNGTCTHWCPLLLDIRIARETGYQAIEIIGEKLYRYLDQGFTQESLKPHLQGLPPVALGFIPDIERQEPAQYQALLDETEKMCACAEQLGIPLVQLLTGPIGPGVGDWRGYMGLWRQPWPEVRELTAKNLRALAQIARSHRVKFYLEMLTWTDVHTIDQALEVFDRAGLDQDDIGFVIDFWHLWTSGHTPDYIAKMDKRWICGVHFDDSLPIDPDASITSHDGRHVWTGGGRIPLKEWIDAVVATGFDGWWSCELFSPKHWELDPWQNARRLRELLETLLV
jgi:sugar phosphate isomerase/epimerase